MLDSWKSALCADEIWVIGCDAYDDAGVVNSRFYRELMWRRAERLHIYLVAGVAPGKGEDARAALAGGGDIDSVTVELPGDEITPTDPGQAEAAALELEDRVGTNRTQAQIHLAELLRLWTQAGRAEKIARWRYFGMAFYCNLGYYADALRYGDGLLEFVAAHIPESERLQWWITNKMLNALTGLGNAEAGLKLAEGDAARLAGHVDPIWRSQLYYLTSMLYARYQKPRDFQKGEEYLDRGLEMIRQADVPEADRHFHYVFNRNGLAMIRSFQGRPEEAIELCRAGIADLNAHIGAEKQRLHRSILHYNVAQVYVATGSYTEALEYYAAAMAMDPNYSEYYNERGNVYIRMGRLGDALADYLRAIELSPPYFEVMTNLGQCYRQLGRLEEALEAYSRALDLEPDQPLAIAGRAKTHEELGHVEAALADYTAALANDAALWELWANRGVMQYVSGQLEASLADLSKAIELAPREPDLYENRATVLSDLGRVEEAELDLESALKLVSTAEQRDALLGRLRAFHPEPMEEIASRAVV